MVKALETIYVEAFGTTEKEWLMASPYHRLDGQAAPWLGVCSLKRPDTSCDQAEAYAEKSRSLGIRASVLPQNKGHGAINKDLGMEGQYTEAVEAFMASLDPVVRHLLH